MTSILLACACMAAKDALMTLLTIAEARGRAGFAGIFDGIGDLAVILVTIAGPGQVIQHGWTGHATVIVAAMTITSTVGTWFWTRVGGRLLPEVHDGDR